MNRTDRLLAIVLEIQAKKNIRAEDLAATFEVTKRTIYRDVAALSESGVPIVAIPGQGYSLVEGYFLPPLSFSSDEAIMLLLGTDFMAQNFDAQYRSAAQSANHKIVAVLPDNLRQEVEYLENSIRFVALNSPFERDTLQRVRRAIIQRRTLRFCYYSRPRDGSSSTPTARDADPYALIHIGNAWLLSAYCHLRHDTRFFRIDRMEEVTVLNTSFTRPANYKIERRDERDRSVVVKALFDAETARWVRESPSFFQVAEENTPDGLLITLTISQPGDILQWLLGWGSHVRVLEPDSLREILVREAKATIKNHQK